MPLLSTRSKPKPKCVSHKRYKIIKIIMFLDRNSLSMKKIKTKRIGNSENSKWWFSAQASGVRKILSNENTVLLIPSRSYEMRSRKYIPKSRLNSTVTVHLYSFHGYMIMKIKQVRFVLYSNCLLNRQVDMFNPSSLSCNNIGFLMFNAVKLLSILHVVKRLKSDFLCFNRITKMNIQFL